MAHSISDDINKSGKLDTMRFTLRQLEIFLAIAREENISRAAETAGIQRQYLHRLMKEEGIDAEQFKDTS